MRPGPSRVALLAVLAALSCSCARENPRRFDAGVPVAFVDNVPIPLRDLRAEILSVRGFSPTLEERAAGSSEVSGAIRTLVERAVVLREGERRGIEVPFTALEEEVARHRADFPEGGLEKALAQVGMSPEEWRERLRRSLLYRKSAGSIASSLVSVSAQDVEEVYRKEGKPGARPERIRVRQFLFESVPLAEAARETLVREGPGGGAGGAAAGVELGSFSREELPPGVPRELFDMREGGVSGPVVLEGAVSLFRVEDREPAGLRTLETEEARIRESLLSARKEEAFRRWLSGACSAADVRVREDLLNRLAGGKR